MSDSGCARDEEFFVHDEEQRREQHGERHHEQQAIRHGLRHHGVLHHKGQQDEAEFPRLGKAEGEETVVQAALVEEFAEDVQRCRLHQHHRQRQAEDGAEFVKEQVEINTCADGDEEEAKQETLEGFQGAFQFVPVFAICQYHPGDEGTQCRREAD